MRGAIGGSARRYCPPIPMKGKHMNESIDKTRRGLLIAGAVSPVQALSSMPQVAMAGALGMD